MGYRPHHLRNVTSLYRRDTHRSTEKPMTNTNAKAPNRFRLYGAMAAVATLVFALLAVTYTTDPAQAQTPGPGTGNTDDSYPNLSTYPQPPALRSRRRDRLHARAARGDHRPLRPLRRLLAHNIYRAGGPSTRTGVGVLHTNECPPLVTQTTVTEIDPETRNVEPPVTVRPPAPTAGRRGWTSKRPSYTCWTSTWQPRSPPMRRPPTASCRWQSTVRVR